jgi:hypothetical protein
MLQDRDAALEARESRVTEKEATARRRAEELIVTFAAVEERKRDAMKAADEQAATSTARLRAWEEQLCCVEALLAERELETRRLADQLRLATAELEEKQRAVAELEATLVERGLTSRAVPQAATVAVSEPTPEPVVSSAAPSAAAAEIVEGPKPVLAMERPIEPQALDELDLPPTVDISDFSADEIEQFNTRRRLGLRNDATLAAEIRSERVPAKKKGWWF